MRLSAVRLSIWADGEAARKEEKHGAGRQGRATAAHVAGDIAEAAQAWPRRHQASAGYGRTRRAAGEGVRRLGACRCRRCAARTDALHGPAPSVERQAVCRREPWPLLRTLPQFVFVGRFEAALCGRLSGIEGRLG